jgi:hypothetical protein
LLTGGHVCHPVRGTQEQSGRGGPDYVVTSANR